MHVANQLDPATTVGVAPGTTTMLLTGPTASNGGTVVGCESPARAARQRYLLYPPGKYVRGVQPASFTMQPATATTATAPTASFTRVPARSAEVFPTAIKRVLDPYGSIESLKGALGGVKRRLGIVLQPYGDRSPNPSYELVRSGKDYGPGVYCTKRPERGPGYRWQTTSQYEPEDRNHGLNGVRGLACRIAGLGCPKGPLGAVPTDMQLATQYGYTPVMSSWIPFKQGMWSPAPWVPPYGAVDGQPQNQGYLTQAGPVARAMGTNLGDVTTDNADVVSMDPATAAVHELRLHQDRMYMLGIVSAAAVASTALINVFKYGAERRDAKRKQGRMTNDPAPVMSGARRRRRR